MASNTQQGYEEAVIVPLASYRAVVASGSRASNTNEETGERKRWEQIETGRLSQAGSSQLEPHDTRRRMELVREYALTAGKSHPFLEKIVNDFMERFPNQINWRDGTYEIIVDGNTLPGTNILRALHFLLAPEDLNYRMPPGAAVLAQVFERIGVPKGWMVAPGGEEDSHGRTPNAKRPPLVLASQATTRTPPQNAATRVEEIQAKWSGAGRGQFTGASPKERTPWAMVGLPAPVFQSKKEEKRIAAQGASTPVRADANASPPLMATREPLFSSTPVKRKKQSKHRETLTFLEENANQRLPRRSRRNKKSGAAKKWSSFDTDTWEH